MLILPYPVKVQLISLSHWWKNQFASIRTFFSICRCLSADFLWSCYNICLAWSLINE